MREQKDGECGVGIELYGEVERLHGESEDGIEDDDRSFVITLFPILQVSFVGSMMLGKTSIELAPENKKRGEAHGFELIGGW